jgi:replicative DNA helicase
VADHGSTALVCSQEMQDTQLIDRAVSFVGRVPLAGLLTGEGMTADDHDKYQAALSRISAAPLFLDEQGALKPGDVRRKARKVKSKRGLAVLVIDYLQLMVGDKDGENRTREVTQITQDLKALAKELSCCVIALSQLNRQVESRPNKRPIMSDLRESGSIEQDADVILAPYRDEYYNADSRFQGLAELLVLKNRQGASGGFVPMSFQGEYTAFGSIFGEWPEEPAAHEKPKRKGRWDD